MSSEKKNVILAYFSGSFWNLEPWVAWCIIISMTDDWYHQTQHKLNGFFFYNLDS
jgi:hypothetical protein